MYWFSFQFVYYSVSALSHQPGLPSPFYYIILIHWQSLSSCLGFRILLSLTNM